MYEPFIHPTCSIEQILLTLFLAPKNLCYSGFSDVPFSNVGLGQPLVILPDYPQEAAPFKAVCFSLHYLPIAFLLS